MEEQLIEGPLKFWKGFEGQFNPLTDPVSFAHPFQVFDLQYDSSHGLNHLEWFGEGIFYIGKMLKVERRYIRHNCPLIDQKRGTGDKFTFYTRITNIALANARGSHSSGDSST